MGLINKYKTYKTIALGVDSTLQLAGIAAARTTSSILDKRVRAPLGLSSMSQEDKSKMARSYSKSLRNTLITSGLRSSGSRYFNGTKAKLIGKYIDHLQKKKFK